MNVIEYLEYEVIELPEPAFPDLEDDASGAETVYLTWFTEFNKRSTAHEAQA